MTRPLSVYLIAFVMTLINIWRNKRWSVRIKGGNFLSTSNFKVRFLFLANGARIREIHNKKTFNSTGVIMAIYLFASNWLKSKTSFTKFNKFCEQLSKSSTILFSSSGDKLPFFKKLTKPRMLVKGVRNS